MTTSWKNVKNILCIRPDNFGDVIMTQPAIRALKETFPGSKITLLTSHAGSQIAPFIKEIDETLVFDLPWVKIDKNLQAKDVFHAIEQIKQKQFDAAIMFSNYSQNPLPSVMLCFLAEVPRRLSFCRENPYELLTDWIPDKEPFVPIQHGVIRQLQLVSSIGATTNNDVLSLIYSEKAKEKVLKKLKSFGVKTDNPFIIVHAGVSEKKRQYPVELFAKTCKLIVEKFHYQILLTGIEKEKIITDSIQQAVNENHIYSLAGELSLEEFIALIDMAKILVSNNTGPVHIAASLQTPVVDMYARTNPEHTPWKVKNKVLYFDVPPILKSKNTVLSYSVPSVVSPMPTPEQVVDAIQELISDTHQFRTSNQKYLQY